MMFDLLAAICVFGPGMAVVPLVVWRMVAVRRETTVRVATLARSRTAVPSPREGVRR
jgi:hypothetical protein